MKNNFRNPDPLHRYRRVVLLALGVLLPMACAVRGRAQALQYVPVVTTFAGGATASTICANSTDTIGDGCVATSSILSGPTTGDSDAAGNIYFADATNNVVRRIDAVTNIITVVAGEVGSTAECGGKTDAIGDGCQATQATLNAPRCVRIDRAGNIVIADVGDQVIRSINKTTGIITLLVGEVSTTSKTPPKNTAPTTPLTTALDSPYNFLFDPAGNMVISNSGGSAGGNDLLMVFAINGLIDPNNSKVYDLAGTGTTGTAGTTNGNGGLASAATFYAPRGLSLDANENVFSADYDDDQVREITSPGKNGQVTAAAVIAGTIAAYAGNGTDATTGNGTQATTAEVAAPQAVAFDNAGILYIEQYGSGNDFIRTVNPATGIINAYAGNGTATIAGDGGPAATASFYTPTGLKWNLGNRLTVMDTTNNRLRNIAPTPFFSGLAVGSTASQNASIQATAAVTPATETLSNTEFKAGTPTGCTLNTALASGAYCTLPVTFAPAGPGLRAGQLRVTDTNGNVYNDALLGVGLAPAAAFYGAPITTLAGNGTAGSSGNGAAATAALVNAPRGGAFDSAGNFYFADSGNNEVREIAKASGNISIVAGTGASGFSGDGAAATAATLKAPTGVAVDAAGNIYIADAGNNRIREVSSNTGFISTIAGTGTAGYTGDAGLATAATLNNPSGIAIDNAGTLYVADTGNNVLRAFNPNGGAIVTLAGNGTAGYAGDGSVPQLAELKAPSAVTVDLAGNIYVADTGNAVVRQIVPILFGIVNFQGNISTYAGTAGGTANTGDGGAATAAGLLTPGGVAVDAAGDLYIAAGGQVRLVSAATGTITTVAGTGGTGAYSGDGGSATAAVIPAPAQNLAVDAVGNVYLSDTAGNRLLLIAGSSAATIAFGSQTVATSSTPQTVTLYNSGNQLLTITGITVPTGYSQSTSAPNSCMNTTVLAAGAICTVTVTFTPPSVANYASQITISDNALNNTSSTQTIPLTGTGVGHLNPTTTTLTYSPANPTYGQSVMLTATINGGTNPSGKVNFVINSTTVVTANVANGQAMYTLTGLSAGMDSVTANYLGDSVNAGSSGSVSFTVLPAVLTVTASNVSIYPTQAIPALTYTVTGYVNNDTAAKAYSGAPALSTSATSSSPVGTYPITAALGTLTSTNYTFVFVPGTLTVLSPTFALSLSPTSLSLQPGQAGATTVTITPTAGYTGTVALSCSSLPADVLCTFNANTLAVNGGPATVQLTISTNNFPEIGSVRRGSSGTLLAMMFGLPMVLLFRKRRRLLGALLAVLVVVGLQAVSGCSTAPTYASPFSGSVTVTGTDTNQATAQAALQLTIQ
jgi:sugar lactone lactonase YvrE